MMTNPESGDLHDDIPGEPISDKLMNSARRIEDWVKRNLSNNQDLDVDITVQLLLTQMEILQTISCNASEDRLFFYRRQQQLCSIALANARSKLRMMCARLAMICREQGQDVSPYGGETEFAHEVSQGTSLRIGLKFMNRADHHEFALTVLEVPI